MRTWTFILCWIYHVQSNSVENFLVWIEKFSYSKEGWCYDRHLKSIESIPVYFDAWCTNPCNHVMVLFCTFPWRQTQLRESKEHLAERDLELQNLRQTWSSPEVHQQLRDLHEETCRAKHEAEVWTLSLRHLKLLFCRLINPKKTGGGGGGL